MHEIVTLQLGQRANYLATHFWNLQESYFTYREGEESLVDHDVHFRPGVGADGSETYTPRTVIYDLKGGFGTLRKHNALYELTEDSTAGQGLWDGQEIIQKQAPIQQSDYQKSLDQGTTAPHLTSETVRYWSDYNRVFYHPRSIVQLNEYELNSQVMPFEDWNVGEDLFNDLDKEHDLLDRDVRPFAEECDQLRALQLFSGSDDAWGGFAARYIDRLRDEYGKKSIWFWAIEDGTRVQRHRQLKRDTNKAKSLYSISPQSSLYVPLIDIPQKLPSYLSVDRRSEWQTSSLLSAAMETVTLPSRLRPYHDFEASLAGDDGRHNIFELQSTINPEDNAEKALSSDEEGSSKLQTKFDIDFTYDGENTKTATIFNQVQVMRGCEPKPSAQSPKGDIGHLRKLRLYHSEPKLQRYAAPLTETVSMTTDIRTPCLSYHSPLRLPILDSFPHGMYPASPSGVSVLTALTASTRTADRIKAIEGTAARMLSVDEREAMVNGLGEIRECYETGWSSGSEDDDD
ncbi:Protein dml1 [Penicillium canariense]|uniref:Protein DML1 n=1 Tax=Penicillium canariense TaxID=189055 RepID=A0A9W9LN07_9EURO|nr:Protein dml1 [Penicillium canariense]KAJ5167424.1 Protein dml1 [Penicillium canariense]